MNTHESYVSLETAKMLKEAGFDWECPEFYLYQDEEFGLRSDLFYNYNRYPVGNNPDGCFTAPTLSVAQRWLREVKDCIILVDWYQEWEFVDAHYGYEINNEHIDLSHDQDVNEFKTYEEALEAAINKCLTILLEEKQ